MVEINYVKIGFVPVIAIIVGLHAMAQFAFTNRKLDFSLFFRCALLAMSIPALIFLFYSHDGAIRQSKSVLLFLAFTSPLLIFWPLFWTFAYFMRSQDKNLLNERFANTNRETRKRLFTSVIMFLLMLAVYRLAVQGVLSDAACLRFKCPAAEMAFASRGTIFLPIWSVSFFTSLCVSGIFLNTMSFFILKNRD